MSASDESDADQRREARDDESDTDREQQQAERC